MATKADFTTEEWSQIQRAPFMAGLAVVAASPSGPFGVVKEMFAVGKMLGEVKAQGSSNELIKALVADIEAGARDLSAPAELKGQNAGSSQELCDRERAAGGRAHRQEGQTSMKPKGSSNGWSL